MKGHPPQCAAEQCSALRTPSQAAGARAAEGGSPYGGDGTRRSSPPGCPDPTLRRGRDSSSALPPQDDSAARCAGRRGHPEERETRDVPSSAHPHAVTTGTSSVIRLAGDRRMPPSPCAGKAFGGRPQGRRAPLRLQNKKLETKNEIKKGCESKLSHPFCFT